ncbi:MarR family winged helix-turn-helix transcriptional regulator [Alphaproteobacteria bacterium]|nr:MarR family winged helix-turn-helix transcriptional regulator [Alphaproteobacteria bacterium]
MNNYRSFLEQNYAEKLAKSESFEYYNNNFKKDLLFYNNDKELMFKHQRFVKYIYSTFPKYIIHRNIIFYYYKSLKCSISVLNKSVAISRTSLKKIINESIEEGWINTRINISNKRQILIFPTELRIKFWLLYSKKKLFAEIDSKLDIARNKLIEYDNLEKNKERFSSNLINKN